MVEVVLCFDALDCKVGAKKVVSQINIKSNISTPLHDIASLPLDYITKTLPAFSD